MPLRVIELEANMWKPARDQEQVREGEGAGVQTVHSRYLGTFCLAESQSPSATPEAVDAPRPPRPRRLPFTPGRFSASALPTWVLGAALLWVVGC